MSTVGPLQVLKLCSVRSVSSADRDSSLEIKYRQKKMKEERESEPERDDKTDGDGSSTPQQKTDKRRGSQVPSGSHDTVQPAL